MTDSTWEHSSSLPYLWVEEFEDCLVTLSGIYIDDLHVLTLNNTMFEGDICNIYTPTNTLSYLDISISICSGRYISDKRDCFNN